MATSSKANISETEIFSGFFILFLKSKLNLEILNKKYQSDSLSIKEFINCETGSYLNVQMSFMQHFHR